MNIQERPANDDDFDLTLAIKATSLRPYIEEIWGWDDAVQYAYHKENFAPENIRILLIENQEFGYVETTEDDREIFLVNLLIKKDFQKKGLGSLVMNRLWQKAVAGNKSLRLEVFKVNKKATAFYKKLGFQVSGETELKFRMTKRSDRL